MWYHPPMRTKITTSVNSIYVIYGENDHLVKIKDGKIVGGNWERILDSQVTDLPYYDYGFRLPGEDSSLWYSSSPTVNKHWYVTTKSQWFLTSMVTSIEEISYSDFEALLSDLTHPS